MRASLRHALTAATTAGSAALLICTLSTSGPAFAVGGPGCEQDTCPTSTPTATPTDTPTATPTDTPTDGSIDDSDSGAIETAPPATPSEALTDGPTDQAGTDADPAAPSTGMDPNSGVSPDGNYCVPEGWYTPSTLYGKYMRGVGPVQSDANGTSRSASVTFTAQASGTVGVSVSTEVNVSMKALIASANTKFGISLSTSVTASLSNSISTTVPAHQTVNAEYGVWRRKFTGTTHYQYSSCGVTSHSVTAYGPYRTGWYLWEG